MSWHNALTKHSHSCRSAPQEAPYAEVAKILNDRFFYTTGRGLTLENLKHIRREPFVDHAGIVTAKSFLKDVLQEFARNHQKRATSKSRRRRRRRRSGIGSTSVISSLCRRSKRTGSVAWSRASFPRRWPRDCCLMNRSDRSSFASASQCSVLCRSTTTTAWRHSFRRVNSVTNRLIGAFLVINH